MAANLNISDGFHVYAWMVTELGLEGGDLLTFALVHQFAQSAAGIYKGNTAYLSAWTGWSDKTSRTHLARLVDAGLIREIRGRDNNTPFCHYALAPDFYEKHPVKITGSPGKNFPDHPVKTSESTPKKLPGELYSIDQEDKNNINIKAKRFVQPTIDEVRAYCAARKNGIDPEAFVAYYESKGWRIGNAPMRSWQAAVVTWERRRESAPASGSTAKPGKESLSDYYRRLMQELSDDYGTDPEQQ